MIMTTHESENYSTLEAIPYQPIPAEDTSKQVVTGNGIEHMNKKQMYGPGAELPEHYETDTKQPSSINHRKWWIIGGIVVVVVLAAVLGGVLGAVLGKKSSNTGDSGSASPLSTPLPPSSTPLSDLANRKVAAVSIVASNATRVYYQSINGGLMEATTASINTNWVNTALGFSAINGSTIAAAVSRPGFDLEISVYYTDAEHIINDVIYSGISNKWNPGVISAKGYKTLSNGSITAMYTQCQLCANTTIIGFQDVNGFIQIANKTSSGWSLTQVNSITPVSGAGMAFQPLFWGDRLARINLYFQQASLNISLAYIDQTNNAFAWTLADTYLTAVAGTPIAAASSYFNTPQQMETWIEVLSLYNNGMQVDTWSGAKDSWLAHQNKPSVMANSTENPKVYSAMSVTQIGRAFAVVGKNGTWGIESWQVGDDYTSWSQLNDVDIGNAWS